MASANYLGKNTELTVLNIQLVTADTPAALIERGHAIHVQAQFSPWKLSTFADCFTPPYYGLFALDENELVGYAIVLEVLDEATLMDIAVVQHCRGRGVGKALLQPVLDKAKARSMREVWLEVRESNLAAIHLYETHGFEHIELRKNYYPTENGKENAAIMKWRNLAIA